MCSDEGIGSRLCLSDNECTESSGDRTLRGFRIHSILGVGEGAGGLGGIDREDGGSGEAGGGVSRLESEQNVEPIVLSGIVVRAI